MIRFNLSRLRPALRRARYRFINRRTKAISKFETWADAKNSGILSTDVWEKNAIREIVRLKHLYTNDEVSEAKRLIWEFTYLFRGVRFLLALGARLRKRFNLIDIALAAPALTALLYRIHLTL